METQTDNPKKYKHFKNHIVLWLEDQYQVILHMARDMLYDIFTATPPAPT